LQKSPRRIHVKAAERKRNVEWLYYTDFQKESQEGDRESGKEIPEGIDICKMMPNRLKDAGFEETASLNCKTHFSLISCMPFMSCLQSVDPAFFLDFFAAWSLKNELQCYIDEKKCRPCAG